MARKLTDKEWLAKLHYCCKCKQMLPISSFWYWIRTSEEMIGRSKYAKRRYKTGHCKNCEKILRKTPAEVQRHCDYNHRRRSDRTKRGLEWVLRKILVGIRKRVKEHSLPFNLTIESLMAQYEWQGGGCYYTGKALTWGIGGHVPNSVSVDRRTPEAGYTQANIVLCTYEANRLKGERTEEEFYSACQKILDHRDSRGT
jgi:hypothetical protein